MRGWLVSYRAAEVYKTATGLRYNAEADHSSIIDQHPALWLAGQRRAVSELEEAAYQPARGPQSATEIVIILSAIEIPDDLLTADQLEYLDR